MEIFQYDFMRRAFIVGILLAVVVPCIGSVMVNKRTSLMGDALSHSSLAGVSIGLITGINPIVGAVLVCLFAGISIEWLRKKFPKGSDLSTAIVMSGGIGLAGVLSNFIPGSSDLESFLFGSIVAIPTVEMFLVIAITLTVLISFRLFYQSLLYIIFDEEGAKLMGVPVSLVNKVFSIITALTIAIASRVVGILMISSLMVLPVSIAMRTAKSYRTTVLLSIFLAVLFMILGLTISYFTGFKPGGVIVLLGVFTLLIQILIFG